MELNIFPNFIIDEVSSTLTYVGSAGSGVSTSQPFWKIMRISKSSTSFPIITMIEMADGNNEYDNIWDNRASLNYSR